MSAAAGDTENFRARLAQAIDLREDGEPEESAEMFAALFADGGGDADAVLEYAKTLRKLDRMEDADRLLASALESGPETFELRRAWAELPRHEVNFEATIARGRILRDKFPPESNPGAWESLSVEMDCCYEMGNWDRLEDMIHEHWARFTRHPEIFPDAIAALNKLFRAGGIVRLADEAAPAAWRSLPPDARGNLLKRSEIAALNLAAIEQTGIKLISIGQNCLPYQLAGRWGLVAARAEPGLLTPFDLGGFINDSVADAIATDFAAFENRDNFEVTRAWGGGKMFLHRPSGVGFFHERGSYWVTPDRARFFLRLASMIANWQLAKTAARKLFVFCYCGAGNLERLVHTASEKLLGPDAHLLVIDVLQQPHTCPAGPFITYRHLPYPRDYDWTSVYQQCSAAGLHFELGVIEAIGWAMMKLDPAAQTCFAHLPAEPPPAAAPTVLSRAELVENIWRFGNGNGNILGEKFCFGATGLIEEYQNDNEAAWKIEDGTLKILRRDGELMWRATSAARDASGAWTIRLVTPHDPNLEFSLTQTAPREAPAAPRVHRYTGAKRVLILRNGLDAERRLGHALANAEFFYIGNEDEIDNFPDCNVFISDLVLTHARTAEQAAAFIARITSRFPLAIFIELSAHESGYLEKSGLQSLHRSFGENTFMDSLNLDFVANAVTSPGIYKIEHFADIPAFDSFKNWVVPNAGRQSGDRVAYQIFDRPIFEISAYACHGFEALDLPLAQDLTLVEMRSLRFRAQSSGFRLDHVIHPRDLGPLLYNTFRDAPESWRNRPISVPIMFEDHEVYRDPRHQALLTRWRGEFRVEIAELSAYEFKHCVIGGTGTLFSGGRFVWGTDYLLMYLNSSSLDPIMLGLQRRHPVQHIDGVAICGFNALYDNYYHFVAEALATMNLCIDLLAGRNLARITLVTGKLNKTRRDYLDLLLQGDPRFVVVDLERSEFVTADTVIYCDNVGRVVYQQVCWEEAPLAEKLIANAGLANIQPSRLLYIARTDTKGRAMRNEQALIERLASLGFEIFVGSQHSVAEQIATFRGAKMIVAPHGAGLTNVLFCHPGTVLLELQQSGYVNTGMMRLAQLGNLRYFSEVFFPAESDSFEDSWLVDVDRVINAIDRISRMGSG
jgi:capsular polysaccharide biosynthesis protein